MRASLLLAATALLAVPASSVAAPPWSPPAAPAPVLRITDAPTLAFASDGSGLLTAATRGRFGDPGTISSFRAFTVTPGQRIVDRGALADSLAVPPLTFGRKSVVLLRHRTLRRASSRRVGRVRLSASFGTTARPAGRPQTLAEFDGAPTVAGAANPRGEVAVAWLEGATFDAVRVRLASRRPGRGFGAPATVASGVGITDVAVAVGARGDLVVAWNRAPRTRPGVRRASRAVVEARARRAGAALAPARRLGPSRGVDRLSAAVGPTGRTVVAWGTNDPGEEVNEPVEVRAAIRPAGPGTFAAAQLLDGGGATTPTGPIGSVVARIAPDGRATVAFSALRPSNGPGARRPVVAVTAGPSGRFAAPETLAADGALSALVVGRDGTATAAWTDFVVREDGDPTIGPVRAATRPAGARAFGRAEAVSDAEPGLLPTLALDATGRAVAAWSTDPFAPSARLRLSRRAVG